MAAALHSIDDPVPSGPCRSCTARVSGLCASISPTDLGNLGHVIRRKVPAGGQLYAEGAANTSYANILSGVVKLTRMLRDGREQIVGLQFANDFLGQRFGDAREVTVQAATDAEICSVPKILLDRLADDSPAVGRRMHQQAATDLEDAREWMMTLGRKDAREKVANLLYKIGKRQSGPVGGPATFDLPLSRADIADHLGLTVETVSRQITKLKVEGMISIVGTTRVSVPDMSRLASAAGL